MAVPSYDDLTPGIPDVAETRTGTAARLVGFLEPLDHAAVVPGDDRSGSDDPAACRYACLRCAPAARDTAMRDTLRAVARDFSPRVMTVTPDEVLLDVSGLGRLIGDAAAIRSELARAVAAAGLPDTTRVALAGTLTRARLLTHGPDGQAIAGLPLGVLQDLETLPPGLPPRDRTRPYTTFERWGLTTLGDLASLPAGDLSSRLGRRGVVLRRLARGLDDDAFVPDPDTPRYTGRLDLEWPIDSLEPLSFVFARLLEPLAAKMERADRAAAAIRLDLRLTDRVVYQRVLQLPAAIRDPRVLRMLLLLDLESAPPPAAVDIVSIELDPAPSRITQFSLLTRALPSPETLATLTARLTALVGESRVGSPVIPDTHRPGACEMARYAPDGANGANGTTGANGANGAGGNGAEGAVLRRCRPPITIVVSLRDGRPAHIAASRRSIPYGALTQASGPWRTSGEWWTATPWHRNEWDVALVSGALCRIYQDRATERWFLEGTYD